MKTLILALTSTVVLAAAFATPAFATSGRDAVGMCIDQPGCSYTLSPDGEINISYGGHWILCPSADADCNVIMLHRKSGGSAVHTSGATSFGR